MMSNEKDIKEVKKHFAINFDLSTKNMTNYEQKCGYSRLKKAFEHENIIHRQYSGYITAQAETLDSLLNKIKNVLEKENWIMNKVERFDITEIGTTFDLKQFVDNYLEENSKNFKKQKQYKHKEKELEL